MTPADRLPRPAKPGIADATQTQAVCKAYLEGRQWA